MSNFKAAIVQVTPFQQNCTILWNEQLAKGVVIDPGGEVPTIAKAIKEVGFNVEKIILTHGHIDHAGGAADLRDALNVPIIGPHKADQMLLDHLEEQAEIYGLPGIRNVEPDQWLEEGETISLAGLDFDIYHCPGHSPGSVVFVNMENQFAVVGDVLFQGSIGRTDFPYGDHEALISSIKQKLLPLGDDISFICGHGPGSTFGIERQTNPFLQ